MNVPRRSLLLTGAGAVALGTGLSGPAWSAPSPRVSAPGAGEELDNPNYPDERDWVTGKVRRLLGIAPSATPLRELPLPDALKSRGLRLCLKDETVHPSGSHKHRLAEALLHHALVSGWIRKGAPVVEASSGSTAISEAWYCRELGLDFTAVIPHGTAEKKREAITGFGGKVVVAGPGEDISRKAAELARAGKGHFVDQFTYAERAYDWRADKGLAAEVLKEAEPDWFVMGAGTGGTVTTLARYARHTGDKVRVCVTDPENSAFFPGWRDNDPSTRAKGSRIEGIGRPRVEPSFLFPLVNRMIQVPDAASIGAMRALRNILGTPPGASTGTGLYGAIRTLRRMYEKGERGTVVTVLCDRGERYEDTYYDEGWLRQQGIDYRPWQRTVKDFFATGDWTPPAAWQRAPQPRSVPHNM